MSLMNMVRSAISVSHQQIELTPFSQGMMNGSLRRSDYANGLVQLWHIHDELENSVLKSTPIAEYFTPEMIRTKTIAKDLKAFAFSLDSFKPMNETLAIVTRFRKWANEQPYSLLGCIYVLEGSRMGSLVIAKPLSKTLGLEPGATAGIEYHTEGAAQTPARLKAFKAKIEDANLDETASNDLIQGAVEFMELLNQLYAALLSDESTILDHQRKTA